MAKTKELESQRKIPISKSSKDLKISEKVKKGKDDYVKGVKKDLKNLIGI